MPPAQNVEQLRRAFESFGEEGIEGALTYMHPDIEWIAPSGWLEEPVYRGHEGLRELASYWTENFDEYRLDIERTIELDPSRYALLLYQRGRIKGSGAPIEQAVGYVVEMHDGKLRRVHAYFSWEDTLEAAGLDR